MAIGQESRKSRGSRKDEKFEACIQVAAEALLKQGGTLDSTCSGKFFWKSANQ